MKRFLWFVGAVVVVSAVALAISLRPTSTPPRDPITIHYADLPRRVYKHGRHVGDTVRVAYPFRLHATADPLVWEYMPGSSSLPPTHRLEFDSAPVFPDRLPVVVVGVVSRIEPDLVIRPNGVPGPVVIRSCRVESSSP